MAQRRWNGHNCGLRPEGDHPLHDDGVPMADFVHCESRNVAPSSNLSVSRTPVDNSVDLWITVVPSVDRRWTTPTRSARSGRRPPSSHDHPAAVHIRSTPARPPHLRRRPPSTECTAAMTMTNMFFKEIDHPGSSGLCGQARHPLHPVHHGGRLPYAPGAHASHERSPGPPEGTVS